MACHIVAASNGGNARRRNSAQPKPLTRDELKSIDNGVWLCCVHGKLVDTDEVRFSVEMLRVWRQLAELRARIHQETGKLPESGSADLSGHRLASEVVKIASLGDENQRIGDALTACSAEVVWGDDFTHQLRDALIELTRNALTHGGAKTVTVSIEPHRIVLTEDGTAFDALSLMTTKRNSGGARSIAALFDHHGNHAVIAYHREKDLNHFTVARIQSADDIDGVTHCYVRLKQPDDDAWERTKGCGMIYVLVPKYWSTSDAVRKGPTEDELKSCGKKLILVMQKSSRSVRDVLAERFPSASIIETSD